MTTFPKRCPSTINKVSTQIKQAGFVEAVLRQIQRTEPFMSPLFALFLVAFTAFNLGNALGPTLGAAALALGFDYRALPWIGSALALLCAATALFSRAPIEPNRSRSRMGVPARLVDGAACRSDA
jgi:hypothetical protein